MEDWQKLMKKSVRKAEDIPKKFKINKKQIDKVTEIYPMCSNSYYTSLIKKKGDGIWKQCIADVKEITCEDGVADPLHEETDSPVPGLVHRYPDRVLLLVSNVCAMYCRFCTRKRKVGKKYETITEEDFKKALSYLRKHKEIRDVIMSGGDPLMLPDSKLEHYISEIRKIKHIEIIRIGTRVPCTLPQRVTPKLCNMLKKYHPLYINTHFNSPYEITKESEKACGMLADAGIPLGNQSVLMKGVNSDPKVMKKLVQELIRIRVKPYYIYIPDNVKGTRHLAASVEDGLKVIEAIRGWTSGMCVPHLIIDIEGGGGKIPILPEYLVKKRGNKYTFRNYEGKSFVYEDI
jgi:lysine 2,3-aminomutase